MRVSIDYLFGHLEKKKNRSALKSTSSTPTNDATMTEHLNKRFEEEKQRYREVQRETCRHFIAHLLKHATILEETNGSFHLEEITSLSSRAEERKALNKLCHYAELCHNDIAECGKAMGYNISQDDDAQPKEEMMCMLCKSDECCTMDLFILNWRVSRIK